MEVLRTILFTAATTIVSFAFVINGVSHVLAGRYSNKQREARAYMPTRELLNQSIMKEWSELQQNAEQLDERIDRPAKLRGKHVTSVAGKSVATEEIDKLVKKCDKFTDKMREEIRNEHKKFKKLPHDYQQVLRNELHGAWHEIYDEAQAIKRYFMELRLTGW